MSPVQKSLALMSVTGLFGRAKVQVAETAKTPAPVQPRGEQILQGLDLRHLVGAEVGTLDRPLVATSSGTVFYVDHCDTAALKQRWASEWAAYPAKVEFFVCSMRLEHDHAKALASWQMHLTDVQGRDFA